MPSGNAASVSALPAIASAEREVRRPSHAIRQEPALAGRHGGSAAVRNPARGHRLFRMKAIALHRRPACGRNATAIAWNLGNREAWQARNATRLRRLSRGRYVDAVHRPTLRDDRDDQKPSRHATTDAAAFTAPTGTRLPRRYRLLRARRSSCRSRLRFVFLCFTNRSGSAYLIDLLASAGITAQALETLNAGAVLPFCREHGVRSFQTYFEHIVRRDARNDIYIVKVAPEQLRLLTEAGILGQIGDSAEFLFMHRADKLGQAISRAIAEQNNRWGWNSPSDFPDDKLVYSAERIAQHIYDIGHSQPGRSTSSSRSTASRRSASSMSACVSQPQHELDEIARRLRLPAGDDRSCQADLAPAGQRDQPRAGGRASCRRRNRRPERHRGRCLPRRRPHARWSAPSRQTSLPMFATSATSSGPAGPGWARPGSGCLDRGLQHHAATGPDRLMTSNTAAFKTLGGCCRGRRPEPTVERVA